MLKKTSFKKFLYAKDVYVQYAEIFVFPGASFHYVTYTSLSESAEHILFSESGRFFCLADKSFATKLLTLTQLNEL